MRSAVGRQRSAKSLGLRKKLKKWQIAVQKHSCGTSHKSSRSSIGSEKIPRFAILQKLVAWRPHTRRPIYKKPVKWQIAVQKLSFGQRP
jgi:hypothetical protein